MIIDELDHLLSGRSSSAAKKADAAFKIGIRPPKLTHLPLQRDQAGMLVRRRPGPCPFVELGSLNPPAKRVWRDAELLPDPRAHPTPATGIIACIEHKPNRTLAKLFSDIYVVLPLVLIHLRGIKNLH